MGGRWDVDEGEGGDGGAGEGVDDEAEGGEEE